MARQAIGTLQTRPDVYVAGTVNYVAQRPNIVTKEFDTVIPAGYGIIQDTNGIVKVADGTATPLFVGVSIASQSTILDSEGRWEPQYNHNGISVLTDGLVTVVVDAGITIVPGELVYMIIATGIFTNVPGSDNMQMVAKFNGTNQGDLCEIRMGVN